MEQSGFTIWFTGLSGSGKSTVAHIVATQLRARGLRLEVLDGDAVRQDLSRDLGFSREDRDTHILRIGWICDLLNRNGVVAIVAAISPYRAVRDEVRRRLPRFVEVYMEAALESLIQRDAKGLYGKAIRGEISHFTGISDPYEAPRNAEVVCFSDGREGPEENAARVISHLAMHKLID